MATSPLNSKTHNYHARSVSLPSRPHPLRPQCDELLGRLQASEAASTSSILGHKLAALCDLYDFVGNMLLLPLNQQALVKESLEKWVGELLDGSVRLLDVCGALKDALLQTREHTRELQSILRRRRGDEFGLSSEVGHYLIHRKQVKKSIHKAVRNLKCTENKCTLDKDNQPVAIATMLKDVETISLTVFESLFSFVAGPKATSKQFKQSNWSLVMRLMQSKLLVASDEAVEISELEKVDATLSRLLGHKTSKPVKMHVDNLQKELGKLELSIQELEEGLECLYRHLVKTRVSLLNVLNVLNH